MTKKIGKSKKLSKAISRERKAIEAENSDVPKTMIFCKPNSSSFVKQLVNDFKCTMKPHTLKEIFCSRSNTLKDYIDYATKNHVKSIIYFTHAKLAKKTCDWNESTNYQRGGVYCNIAIMPHGPTFTYRVKEYSLKRDIQTLTGLGMNNNYMLKPPLLICEGFGNSENTDYLKAVSSSFQNMLPTLNINKMQFGSVRRVLLLSHQNLMPETDEETQKKLGEVFVFRHYMIRLENKELNKNVRKLGVGISSKNVKIPDLSKYGSIAEFVSRSGHVSESEMSDCEGATIELTESVKELPGSTGKTAVRLMEVGPRMILQLIKIQEGIHSGALLYHRVVKRTKEEIFEMEKKKAEQLKLKEKRREQQLKNVEKKQKMKEDHKKKCLEGMKAKGYLKDSNIDEDDDDDENNEVNETDEIEGKKEIDINEDEEMVEELGESENGDGEEDDLEENEDNGLDEDEDDDPEEDDDDDDSNDMENVNDSLDENSNDSEMEDEDDPDGIEEIGDDSDEINISDCESNSSDEEIEEKEVKQPSNKAKRSHSNVYKNTKKKENYKLINVLLLQLFYQV